MNLLQCPGHYGPYCATCTSQNRHLWKFRSRNASYDPQHHAATSPEWFIAVPPGHIISLDLALAAAKRLAASTGRSWDPTPL